MNRSLIFVAIFLAILCSAHTSNADTLPGASESIFLTAVDAWLEDNDADSLPILSSQANEGNVAARLLLSRIEITDRAPSGYVKNLLRKDRLNLFRPPGNGMFRPSWLKIESDAGNPTAEILLEATTLGINLAGIRRLYDIGEIEATEHLVRKIAVDGSQSERQELAGFLPSDSELAPYLRAFRYEKEGVTTGQSALQHIVDTMEGMEPGSVDLGKDGDARIAMMFVDIGYQAGNQTIDYGENNRYFGVVTKWIMSAPEAMGIANLCRRICSDQETSACANIAFGLIGGYYEVVRFDSPLEIVVPQARFLASERAIGMTLRRLAFTTTEAGEAVFFEREFSDNSKCLADAVTELRARPN